MKSVLFGLVGYALAASAGLTTAPSQDLNSTGLVKVAVVCFFKHDYVSGMNKICVYDCLGSDAAITIGAVQLCPLTINR
jgi:hypothetical protein